MKPVRLEFKSGEYRLVVKDTGKIVAHDKNEKKCLSFLLNQREYGYMPTFKKGQHYAV